MLELIIRHLGEQDGLAELVRDLVEDEPSSYVVVPSVFCSVSKTWAYTDGRGNLST